MAGNSLLMNTLLGILDPIFGQSPLVMDSTWVPPQEGPSQDAAFPPDYMVLTGDPSALMPFPMDGSEQIPEVCMLGFYGHGGLHLRVVFPPNSDFVVSVWCVCACLCPMFAQCILVCVCVCVCVCVFPTRSMVLPDYAVHLCRAMLCVELGKGCTAVPSSVLQSSEGIASFEVIWICICSVISVHSNCLCGCPLQA